MTAHRLAAIVLALGLAAGAKAAMRPLGDAPPDVPSLRGKVVVLNFWATWCAPCVRELPDLAEIAREFRADVSVIAVATEPEENAERVQAFLIGRGVELPLWIGADASDMARYGLAETLPATVVLDRDGEVALRIQGAFDRADLERHVAEIVSGTAPDHAHAKPVAAAVGSRVPS